MPDRILLLASARTYRNRAFTQAAKKLGLEVVLGLDVPPPMLRRQPNCLALDYRDLSQSAALIADYAREQPVKAILGVDDSGTLLAARASAELGLSHNAPQSVEAANDKSLMRERFRAAGLPSPKFLVARITDDPEELLDVVPETIGFPCVLKPTRLSASKGVMRADHPQEFIERFARLRRIVEKEDCPELLIEAFIPGVEVALEGLLRAGELSVLALFDKPDPLDGPFFEETIYVTPSRLPQETQQSITRVTQAACAALGLREGPVHAELRVDLTPSPASPARFARRDRSPPLPLSYRRGGGDEGGGEVTLIEVAARSIGGLCSQVLRFTHRADVSLEELILRQAIGLEVEAAHREPRAGGVMMIPIPGAGLLKSVSGIEDAERVPLIEGVAITAPLNYPLAPLPEGDSYLGFIFARGETPAEVEAALREAHRRLRFEIAPEIPLVAGGQGLGAGR